MEWSVQQCPTNDCRWTMAKCRDTWTTSVTSEKPKNVGSRFGLAQPGACELAASHSISMVVTAKRHIWAWSPITARKANSWPSETISNGRHGQSWGGWCHLDHLGWNRHDHCHSGFSYCVCLDAMYIGLCSKARYANPGRFIYLCFRSRWSRKKLSVAHLLSDGLNRQPDLVRCESWLWKTPSK